MQYINLKMLKKGGFTNHFLSFSMFEIYVFKWTFGSDSHNVHKKIFFMCPFYYQKSVFQYLFSYDNDWYINVYMPPRRCWLHLTEIISKHTFLWNWVHLSSYRLKLRWRNCFCQEAVFVIKFPKIQNQYAKVDLQR